LTVVSVDSRNKITLSSAVTISDTDEVYLTLTKQNKTISILWDPLHDWFDLPANGQVITGATVSNNRLIICQENSTHRWDGSGLVTVDPVVGCSDWFAITTVGRFSFWMHKGMIYRYDGFVPVPIANQILPALAGVPDYMATIALPDRLYSRVFFFLGTLTDPVQVEGTNMWAVYDIMKDNWSFRSDLNMVTGFVDDTINGYEQMIGVTEDAQMFLMNVGTDSAVPYSMKTKYDSQDDPAMVKQYRYIAVVCPEPGGSVFYSLDYNRETYQPLGQIKSKFQIFALPEEAKGNVLSVRWAGNEEGKSPSYLGHEVFYEELGYIVNA
jgi:hypothetical protein